MIEGIYVLFDIKAGIALKPLMVERNDVVPIRNLTDLTNDPNTIIARNPEDFAVIHIGAINLETLAIEGDQPRTIARATEVKKATE